MDHWINGRLDENMDRSNIRTPTDEYENMSLILILLSKLIDISSFVTSKNYDFTISGMN